MKNAFAALAGASACLLLAPAAGQEPIESHAVIHSDTRLVLVDAVVTDKKGKYIRNLTKKDFKVYQDSQEQTITTFSSESSAPPLDNSRKHYLVLFFDNSSASLPQQACAREAATKFIDANAAPNRLMAIAEFGGALRVTQDFTDNVERLKQVVSGVKFASVGPAAGGGLFGRGGSLFNDFSIRSVLGALRNMAKGLSGIPGRKTLVFLSGGFLLTVDTMSDLTATIDVCNRANVAVYPIDIRGLAAPIGSLRNGRRLLRLPALPGPSALLSTGFLARSSALPGAAPPGSRPPTTGTAGGGSRTGAPAGTGTAPAKTLGSRTGRTILPPMNTTVAGPAQSLYVLAEGTGGFVIIHTNDILGGLERIGQEQNEYYILGYAPSKEAEPGACHSLRVKVDREGASVRSRSGYCEAKPLDVLSGTLAQRDLEARITGNAAPTVADASMLAPFFYISANTVRVNLALNLPAGTLKFARIEGKFRSVLNIVGIAYLEDGSVGARFSDSVKWSFEDKKEMDAGEKTPLHYQKQFEMAPGRYTLKVAFSSGANQFGRLERPLVIESWDPDQFTISSLALSRALRPVPGATTDFDPDLLENRVPLVVGDLQFVPSGSNRFKKTERAFVYAEIYEPAMVKLEMQEKDVPAVTVRMELLDPKTGELKKDLGITRAQMPPLTGNPRVPVGLVVSAPELAPGLYRLRVVATDSLGHAIARSTGIELEE
jgi:VWFA-related protein